MHRSFSQQVEKLHTICEDFCFAANEQIAERPSSHPLAGTALFSLGADTLALHRAVRSLCEAGWAFCCPLLLRAQMDGIVNLFAITVPPKSSEYMAFKYFYSYLIDFMPNDISQTTGDRIKRDLDRLDEANRRKAEALLKSGKARAYWYQPEYKRPAQILDEHAPMLNTLWTRFAGTTHGGYLGVRLFRDDKNTIHPGPRADRHSQDRALLVSSRLIVEFFHLRSQFERIDTSEHYQEILGLFTDIGGVKEEESQGAQMTPAGCPSGPAELRTTGRVRRDIRGTPGRKA